MAWLTPTLLTRLTGLLILLAFFAQNLVPTGYMPRFDTDQGFEITICQGADAQTIRVDRDMNPITDIPTDHPQQDTSKNSTCIFSLHSTVVLLNDIPLYMVKIPLTHPVTMSPSIPSRQMIMPEKSYHAQAPPLPFPLLLSRV